MERHNLASPKPYSETFNFFGIQEESSGTTERVAWFGGALFWVATAIAGLIAVWVLSEFVYDSARGQPIIQYHAWLIAGIIWLVGGLPPDARWTQDGPKK